MAFATAPNHKLDCRQPAPVERATLAMGDIIVQCRECKTRWAVPPPVGRASTQPTESTPQPEAAPSTGYVCRVHHDQPTSWRGTGCTLCTRKTKPRKAPHWSED